MQTARTPVIGLFVAEQGPGGDEKRGDQRTDHEAIDPGTPDPANRRNQHHVVRQPGILADQRRAQGLSTRPIIDPDADQGQARENSRR